MHDIAHTDNSVEIKRVIRYLNRIEDTLSGHAMDKWSRIYRINEKLIKDQLDPSSVLSSSRVSELFVNYIAHTKVPDAPRAEYFVSEMKKEIIKMR